MHELKDWQTLCDQAAAEQDPNIFHQLIREILRMLTEKERRLEEAKGRKNAA